MQQQANLLLLAPTRLATLVRPYLLLGSLLTRRSFPTSDYNAYSNQSESVEPVEIGVVDNLCRDKMTVMELDVEDNSE